MRIVLDAIGRARHPAARGAVRAAFFKLGRIRGGIGTYRFSANGDTSLTTLDGYRVTASGALVRLRTIRVPAPPLAPLASSGGP